MAGATTTINAASTALAVALQDYLDGLAAGTKVIFTFAPLNANGTALDTGDFPCGFGTAGSAANFNQYIYTIKKVNSSDNMLYCLDGMAKELGCIPLFWKITASGSTSLATS
jgi:hypothetical protein